MLLASDRPPDMGAETRAGYAIRSKGRDRLPTVPASRMPHCDILEPPGHPADPAVKLRKSKKGSLCFQALHQSLLEAMDPLSSLQQNAAALRLQGTISGRGKYRGSELCGKPADLRPICTSSVFCLCRNVAGSFRAPWMISRPAVCRCVFFGAESVHVAHLLVMTK